MSKLTISTTKLQALVAKAVKGVGTKKDIRITSLIGIKAGEKLSLCTTDGSNYFQVSDELGWSDSIDVAVDATTFASLVSKLTSDNVTLEVKGNTLVITSNGTYKLPLELSDMGGIFSFADISAEGQPKLGELSLHTISTIINSVKPSLSSIVQSVYSNYLFGEYIVGTDRCMMCKFDTPVFETNTLVSREFIDLLGLAPSDVTLYGDSTKIIAVADNFILSASVPAGIENFNISGVQKMLDLEVNSFCRVKRSALLPLLERLAIFVGAYDDGAVTIEFKGDTLEVSSLSSSGVEAIDILETKDAKDFTIKININRLITQLKAYQSDAVDLYYGNDVCIKLVDGDITEVIALMR